MSDSFTAALICPDGFPGKCTRHGKTSVLITDVDAGISIAMPQISGSGGGRVRCRCTFTWPAGSVVAMAGCAAGVAAPIGAVASPEIDS